jgi:type VI secretion system protein ImpH
MATSGRQPGPALIASLVGQYARFDVFQLVRLLRLRGGRAWPTTARVRFRADLGAAFPGHEVTRLGRARPLLPFRSADQGEDLPDVRIELRTPNYCLASELGPLPQPFLEWVREQERIGGHAMADFLDVFNQRVHVLRHDLKQRTVRALDPEPPARTLHARQLSALIGVALPAQQQQIPLPSRAWLGLSALLVDHRRSAAVVAQVLSIYLGARCTLRNLIGRWRPIEPVDRMSLGRSGNVLGRQSLLGRRTWDARAAVALDVETLSYDAVCALLPMRPSYPGEQVPSASHLGLVAMVRMLLDRGFDCEVTLVIDPATAPRSRLLSPRKSGGYGLRLGQTAWLGRPRGRPLRFVIAAFEPAQARGGAA